MQTIITPITLKNEYFQVQAFKFSPINPIDGLVAVASHGYTSSKTSLINWASRLSAEGCTTIIFDLPGHYLGSFNQVNSFDDFAEHAHDLFALALKASELEPQTVILLGHSLGAFLSLKAAESFKGQLFKSINICVGLGLLDANKPHLMETKLYKSTLDTRRQLVSDKLFPEKVFAWLKTGKELLKLSDQDICLLNGLDDAVVTSDSTQRLTSALESLGNHVFVESPKCLPHHQPELAAPHIISILKKRFQVF